MQYRPEIWLSWYYVLQNITHIFLCLDLFQISEISLFALWQNIINLATVTSKKLNDKCSEGDKVRTELAPYFTVTTEEPVLFLSAC